MKSYNKFKVIDISDIHFGNGRVTPINTYNHLVEFLYPKLEDVQLLLISGDTFDTLLNMNSQSGLYVAMFIDDIINLAIKHHFYIRVLRGTFSHDRHQNQFFTVKDKNQNKLNDIDLVRVIDKIEIEYFPLLNINVLFCPDDQPYDDLNQAVIDVINVNHLKQVDIMCTHGYYEHLLPKGLPTMPHNVLSFNLMDKYVSGLMFNGHVHKSSTYRNKVLNVGSFERFEHDNINPVGYYIASAEKEAKGLKWSFEFIENTLASPFKTIYCNEYKSSADLCLYITMLITNIRKNISMDIPIYLRLYGNADVGIINWVKETFGQKVYVTLKQDKKDQDENEEEQLQSELPIITEDNLAEMIHKNLSKDANMSLNDIQEILNGI